MLTDAFLQLKSNLELTPHYNELIQQRHNATRTYLENNHAGVVDTKLIGSVRRKTRIQPLPNSEFDIDILVLMGSFNRWLPPGALGGVTPEKTLSDLRKSVTSSDRYGTMNPQHIPPTISIEYGDRTIVEFVPAYLDKIGASADGTPHGLSGRAYWVPIDGKWQLSDYDYDTEYISSKNSQSDGWLIPTIKRLKAIRRGYFSQMRSFHLEIIATFIIPILVAARKENKIEVSYPALIRDFFKYAPAQLTLQSKLPGSHSRPIVLSQAEFTDLTNIFQKIAAYIEGFQSESQEFKHLEGWKLLFGTPFPA